MTVSSADDIVAKKGVFDCDRSAHSEADHRIANSLQLLSALLSSQRREVRDPIARAALDTSVHRIGAIAGVHRQLYASQEGGVIDLSAYLMDLVSNLQSGFSCGPEHRNIHLEAQPLMISSDFAGLVGIIVTELVINACKHAYGHDQRGDIQVVWAVDCELGFSLKVCDQGRGRRHVDGATGLGARIIGATARKLDAEVSYAAVEKGTCFVMAGTLPSR